MELKRYQTLSLGDLPPKAAQTIENIKQYKNPWGLPAADRFKWAEGLDVPIIQEDSPEVEYLYYVGCAGSYDPSNQKVVKAIIGILKHCNVSFAVMGKKEQCNGDPVKRFGDEYSFSEIAQSNVKELSKLKFKKILTHCPHCYSTLKNDFKDYGGHYTVLHHTQLLSSLLKKGELKLKSTVKTDATFHDPCFLGRHNGEYDAPRDILNHIKGLELQEMTFNKSQSSCCGMGGGNMWHEIEDGESIVKKRLEHVEKTQAKTLVTGCSFCLINFKSTFETLKNSQEIDILDIAQVVEKAMKK
jgi:Fe-S oxidoreductase